MDIASLLAMSGSSLKAIDSQVSPPLGKMDVRVALMLAMRFFVELSEVPQDN